MSFHKKETGKNELVARPDVHDVQEALLDGSPLLLDGHGLGRKSVLLAAAADDGWRQLLVWPGEVRRSFFSHHKIIRTALSGFVIRSHDLILKRQPTKNCVTDPHLLVSSEPASVGHAAAGGRLPPGLGPRPDRRP